MGEVFTLRTEFDRLTCQTCGLEYMVPTGFHNARRNDRQTWYCPNGHQWCYRETEDDRIRRERDQLKQRIAQKDDEIAEQRAEKERQRLRAEALERKVSAARGQITKIKKRAANGVCPCCNRTFADLARHMHSKHPGFVSEPTADEHVH